MTDAAHDARPTRKLVGVVLVAVVALLLPAGVVSTAQGAPGGGGRGGDSSGGNATSIVFTSILDADTTLPVTPGSSRLAYVVEGQDFDVSLAFVDRQGRPAALSSSNPTTVTLYYSEQALPLITGTVDPGARSIVITSKIADAARNVRLTAVAATSPKQVSGSSGLFDVLLQSVRVEGTTSVGTGSSAGCDPIPAQPVCGDLVPPTNGFDGDAFLSLADCTAGNSGPDCKQSYVQALSKFNEPTGLLPPPATLFMKCDKSLCGGGAISRQRLSVVLSSDPDSEFFGEFDAPTCPAKGVVSYDPGSPYGRGNLPFCVDYVQSTRDIAGDTILALVFVEDAKVRFL